MASLLMLFCILNVDYCISLFNKVSQGLGNVENSTKKKKKKKKTEVAKKNMTSFNKEIVKYLRQRKWKY